jgi:Fur family zinc uptake transcriptional regulator
LHRRIRLLGEGLGECNKKNPDVSNVAAFRATDRSPKSVAPEDYADYALSRLRERGFRITRGRRLILDALSTARRPLSPYALHDLLAGRGDAVDTVSIYRTLDTLETQGLAHRVASTGGYLPCRLEDHPGCHHHLICRECGLVEEVDCPGMTAVERGAAKDSQFRIERHLVEFVGLCPSCQPAAG